MDMINGSANVRFLMLKSSKSLVFRHRWLGDFKFFASLSLRVTSWAHRWVLEQEHSPSIAPSLLISLTYNPICQICKYTIVHSCFFKWHNKSLVHVSCLEFRSMFYLFIHLACYFSWKKKKKLPSVLPLIHYFDYHKKVVFTGLNDTSCDCLLIFHWLNI